MHIYTYTHTYIHNVYIYTYIYIHTHICIYGPKFDPWVGKIPWRREWQSTPVSLPREFHRQRSLADYSPCGCKGSDTTE